MAGSLNMTAASPAAIMAQIQRIEQLVMQLETSIQTHPSQKRDRRSTRQVFQDIEPEPPDRYQSNTNVSNNFYYRGPNLPTFSGKEDYLKWEGELDGYFRRHQFPKKEQAPAALSTLRGEALRWWKQEKERQSIFGKRTYTWSELKRLLFEHYLPHQLPPKTCIKRTPKPLVKHATSQVQKEQVLNMSRQESVKIAVDYPKRGQVHTVEKPVGEKLSPPLHENVSKGAAENIEPSYCLKLAPHVKKQCPIQEEKVEGKIRATRLEKKHPKITIHYQVSGSYELYNYWNSLMVTHVFKCSTLSYYISDLMHLIFPLRVEERTGTIEQRRITSNCGLTTNQMEHKDKEGLAGKPLRLHPSNHDCQSNVKTPTPKGLMNSHPPSNKLDFESSTSCIMHLSLSRDVETGLGLMKDVASSNDTILFKEEPPDGWSQVFVKRDHMKTSVLESIPFEMSTKEGDCILDIIFKDKPPDLSQELPMFSTLESPSCSWYRVEDIQSRFQGYTVTHDEQDHESNFNRFLTQLVTFLRLNQPKRVSELKVMKLTSWSSFVEPDCAIRMNIDQYRLMQLYFPPLSTWRIFYGLLWFQQAMEQKKWPPDSQDMLHFPKENDYVIFVRNIRNDYFEQLQTYVWRPGELAMHGDRPFKTLEDVNDNDYHFELAGEINVSSTFNVADLECFDADNDLVLRTKRFQEGGNDEDIGSSQSTIIPQVPSGLLTHLKARAHSHKFSISWTT